jgi:hypothetical protein
VGPACLFNEIQGEDSMAGARKPGRNFLFVPGPTNVPDRILRAMHIAMEDHRSANKWQISRHFAVGR